MKILQEKTHILNKSLADKYNIHNICLGYFTNAVIKSHNQSKL